MRKNLAIVTTWFERGAAYVSKQLMKILSKNYNVFIYVRGGEKYARGDENWDKNYVWWGKKKYFPILTYIDIKDFNKFLTKNNIEIVIFNEQLWWEPVVFCKEKGILTGSYIDNYKEDNIELFGLYDFLICNTKRHYEVFKWHPQAYYIPWGTDINLFYPKKLSSVNNERLIFFHSSGMNPDRKGTKFLIKAVKDLYDKSQSFKLIIHSQVDLYKFLDQNEIKILKKFIDDNIIELIIKTVPAPGLYYLGDVYVYPTVLEGIGLTIAEAISMGLPTIVPDNAPMNEFVKDGVNGKLVKINKLYSRADGYYWPKCEVNIKDLSDKMYFYIQNFENLNMFKKETRKYAEKYLNWDENSSILNNLLMETKKIKINNFLKNKALNYYNKIYPMIWKYRKIYEMFDYLYHKVKK
jgi:1,2-diacylglycerol 3-alpha-glucosyltransferase